MPRRGFVRRRSSRRTKLSKAGGSRTSIEGTISVSRAEESRLHPLACSVDSPGGRFHDARIDEQPALGASDGLSTSVAFPTRKPWVPVRWYRLRELASLHTGTRQHTKAFWNWLRRATSRSAGPTGPGVCHSCETGLVSGAVVYGPEPLDKPADGNLLVCCSQPTRDIVIDL